MRRWQRPPKRVLQNERAEPCPGCGEDTVCFSTDIGRWRIEALPINANLRALRDQGLFLFIRNDYGYWSFNHARERDHHQTAVEHVCPYTKERGNPE